MPNLKLYVASGGLNSGTTVKCDTKLYVAVQTEAIKQGGMSYADYVRSVLAAVVLDKTYGDVTPQQGQLIVGNTYYTESDIQVYESQISTLKNQLSDLAITLRNKDIEAQNSQLEITKLNNQIQQIQQEQNPQNPWNPAQIPRIPQNQNPQNPWNPDEILRIPQHQNPQNPWNPQANEQPENTQPQNQSGTNQNQFGINQNQSGIELSEFGINKPIPEAIPLNMEQIIQDKFVEVVGNELVVEYFNQQTKLNQSFGISGFSGSFQTVEEIPNSLLEHHPYVVYWKKQVGQYENAIVNATEAFFNKDKTVQQMNQNERMALAALMKREQMLWWLITHFTTIRGFDGKYFEYLMNTVKTQCEGFPVMANPYHENILNANNQPYYGEQ